MELSRPGDVPEVNSSKEDANGSNARASFMALWMQRLRGGEAVAERDDDSETKKKSKKKSRKFGKYILGKLGFSKGDKESDHKKQDENHEQARSFASGISASKPEKEADDTNKPVMPEASIEIAGDATIKTSEIEASNEPSQAEETPPTVVENATSELEPKVFNEKEPDSQPDIATDRLIQDLPKSESQEDNLDNRVLHDATQIANVNEYSTAEKPIVEDNSEALAEEAINNLDIEHDKRVHVDRKLKKELKDLREQVEVIEKDADKLKKDSVKRYEKARTGTNQVEQRVTANEQEQRMSQEKERRADTRVIHETHDVPPITKEAVAKPSTPERSKESGLIYEERKQQSKAEAKERLVSLRQEAKLKETIESYEGIKGSNLTELEIERKHEVKDDPSSYPVPPTADPGVSSIGSILKSIDTPMGSSDNATNSTPAPKDTEDTGSPMYKQAIWGGFWFAIILIITAILLVLSI